MSSTMRFRINWGGGGGGGIVSPVTVNLTGHIVGTGTDDGTGTINVPAGLIATGVTPAAYSMANISVNSMGRITAASSGTIPALCQGRLSLSATAPIFDTSLTAQPTLYFVPYLGDQVSLYDGSANWEIFSISSAAAQVTFGGTVGGPNVYDIYLDYNGGSPMLGTTPWSSFTSRGYSLSNQDSVLCMPSSSTQRYLGTIYVNANNLCPDNPQHRSVWNYYNRVSRKIYVAALGSTIDTSNTFWQILPGQAGAGNALFHAVCGVGGEDAFTINYKAFVSNSGATGHMQLEIGEDYVDNGDSSNLPPVITGEASVGGSTAFQTPNIYTNIVSVSAAEVEGYHSFAPVVRSTAGTTRFYIGTAGGGLGTFNPGMFGTWMS